MELNKRKMTFLNNLPESIVVKGVKSLLYSVFRNLTDNAISYAGDGTTITLNAYEKMDTGISASSTTDWV